MEFIDKKLEAYVQAHSSEENEQLKALDRETHLKVLNPRMLAGAYQGRLLSMLSHMIKPKRVLEIGTYTGYSSICFAEGLQAGGEIITIDHNEELASIQNKYFKQTGLNKIVKQISGNAIDKLADISGPFDLVFLDADKENYLNYYHLCFEKIPVGGYLLADNVLWSGKVLEKPSADDADTIGLQKFNRFIQEDNRVENILLPIRDGIMILRKIKN